jgi:hypothetical protein
VRSLLVFVLLMSGAFGGTTKSKQEIPTDGLSVELRSSSNRVKLQDEMVVTVFFRSPRKDTTIWNALGWGGVTGLRLQVLDSSGHDVENRYVQLYDVLPPDETGKNALISIGGNSFAGFDSHIPVKMLFPGPGRYTIKCIYSPTLPRHYFQGTTIWGKEDGVIESPGVSISVSEP